MGTHPLIFDLDTMSITGVTISNFKEYISVEKQSLSHHDVIGFFSPWRLAKFLTAILYVVVQRVIVFLFKPSSPKDVEKIRFRGRVAVVGAGLTGISSAAHAIAHGFDVVIYEADNKVGGIWANVNSTSGLQLNSMLYRFHPAVIWSRGFPFRDEILSEISRVWREYRLESRTRFNTRVTSVRRASPMDVTGETDPTKDGHARWVINDGADGIFDAVIVTVGTCGDPLWVEFPGMPKLSARGTGQQDPKVEEDQDFGTYRGPILHSSELDSPDASQVREKTVVVIGSGASGVEAVETALFRGATKCIMLARDDKWIIPRNMFIDVLIAMQPFGREMPLSFLWEIFLAKWHYRGVQDLVPPYRGLFEGTPVVNDEFLPHIRSGACEYIRGDTRRLTSRGVLINSRPRLSKPGIDGEEREIAADVVVLATGYKNPSVEFLPKDLFPEGYERPNLYLQSFSTEDWSILLTNSAYKNAIGTVGHFHIGIYTRILLTLLMDTGARPSPKDMKLWVDVVRFIKHGATGGAFGFFTYMELTIWLVMFHVLRPDRLRWLPFIMFGWGVRPQYNEL